MDKRSGIKVWKQIAAGGFLVGRVRRSGHPSGLMLEVQSQENYGWHLTGLKRTALAFRSIIVVTSTRGPRSDRHVRHYCIQSHMDELWWLEHISPRALASLTESIRSIWLRVRTGTLRALLHRGLIMYWSCPENEMMPFPPLVLR